MRQSAVHCMMKESRLRLIMTMQSKSNLHLSGFVRKMSHKPSDEANKATSPQKANDNECKIAREWDQRAVANLVK